jgi:hypothetical protein
MIVKLDHRGWTAAQWAAPCVICGEPTILRSPARQALPLDLRTGMDSGAPPGRRAVELVQVSLLPTLLLTRPTKLDSHRCSRN